MDKSTLLQSLSMGKIRVLSESTINQIAAGEVIENPASVLKELVDNSLDAGARKIWVEVRGGGFQLIRVADDGFGMSRDDAVLAFERHATSKLRELNDLNALESMGFRGEALASIGAISQVELVSAEEGQEGTLVRMEGGKILACQKASRPRGTTVSVSSLFYNTPARKKFQKGAASSLASIHKLLFSLSLSYPEVGFELVSNGEIVLSVSPETRTPFVSAFEKRINALFKGSFLQSRKPISLQNKGYELQGFFSPPVDHRINRSGQYLFVNRRPVLSPLISSAVKSGYGHRLDERRYPLFALHLTVPPHLLDVNVHPQKREVRFGEEEWLKEFVETSVRSLFQGVAPVMPPAAPVVFEQMPPLMFREEKEEAPLLLEEPDVIGLYGPYLLLAEKEGVVWVHLQKIQEKNLQKELRTSPKSQRLLLPIPLELSKEQAIDLEEKKEQVEKVGFSIERSGKDSFLIHALPACLKESDAKEAIELLLEGEDALDRFARFAVRGKKQFMIKEALALWQQAKNCSDPECIAKVGLDEIERLFRAGKTRF